MTHGQIKYIRLRIIFLRRRLWQIAPAFLSHHKVDRRILDQQFAQIHFVVQNGDELQPDPRVLHLK